MGAMMTQRPDLFGAIVCGAPLLDMLRYQNMLVGSWWVSEYGSADDPKQFEYLLKYSPYHNVKPGTRYPAVMFMTGDADTRVDPSHARKMAARVQAANASDNPILLRFDEQVDRVAFLASRVGIKLE
jgi:prolyl oligopeptidase